MSFWKRIFGIKEVQVEPIVEETFTVEPIVQQPVLNERDQKIADFSKNLKQANTAIESSRETLYEKKAELSSRKTAAETLRKEINGNRITLRGLEAKHAEAKSHEVEAIEIKAQRLQNEILKKEARLTSALTIIEQFTAAIDTMERSLTAKEMELVREEANLSLVETGSAILDLHEAVNGSISGDSFLTIGSDLEQMREKQRMQMEDIDLNTMLSANVGDNQLVLSFKDRMAAGETIEVEIEDAEISVTS